MFGIGRALKKTAKRIGGALGTLADPLGLFSSGSSGGGGGYQPTFLGQPVGNVGGNVNQSLASYMASRPTDVSILPVNNGGASIQPVDNGQVSIQPISDPSIYSLTAQQQGVQSSYPQSLGMIGSQQIPQQQQVRTFGGNY